MFRHHKGEINRIVGGHLAGFCEQAHTQRCSRVKSFFIRLQPTLGVSSLDLGRSWLSGPFSF